MYFRVSSIICAGCYYFATHALGGEAEAVAVALRGEDASYFTTSAPSGGREKFNNS